MEKIIHNNNIWRLCIKKQWNIIIQKQRIHIPPKELGVIILLLNADGEMLAKKRLSIRSGARVLPVMNPNTMYLCIAQTFA